MKIGLLRFSNLCGYNCLSNDLEMKCPKLTVIKFLGILFLRDTWVYSNNIYLLFRKICRFNVKGISLREKYSIILLK